mgnify:CR=1 FL=1
MGKKSSKKGSVGFWDKAGAAGKGILAGAVTLLTTGNVVEAIITGHNVYRSDIEEKTREATKIAERTYDVQGGRVKTTIKDNAKDFAKNFGDASYDVDTSSAYELRRMQEELRKMQESFKDKATKIEDDTVTALQTSISQMIHNFEEINDVANLHLNIAYLKEMESRLDRQVKGYIQNKVKRRLSIDDVECKEILRIEGAHAKELAMQRFQEEIFSDAINSLWNIIEDTVREQNNAIFHQIENRLTTIRMNAEDSIRQFEEIKKDKQSNKEELEAKRQNYQNLLDIATWCAEALEGENQI